jgi:hypothetical protein
LTAALRKVRDPAVRDPRRAFLILTVLGACALPLLAGGAAAADLRQFTGTWPYTAAGCRDYLHGRIPNEARKRGAGLLIIRPAEIEWVTPATCALTDLRGGRDGWRMNGRCEIKGRDFAARLALTAKDANHIGLRTEAAELGNETHDYARCDRATEWRAD